MQWRKDWAQDEVGVVFQFLFVCLGDRTKNSELRFHQSTEFFNLQSTIHHQSKYSFTAKIIEKYRHQSISLLHAWYPSGPSETRLKLKSREISLAYD